MKKTKILVSLLLTAILAVSVCACSGSDSAANASESPQESAQTEASAELSTEPSAEQEETQTPEPSKTLEPSETPEPEESAEAEEITTPVDLTIADTDIMTIKVTGFTEAEPLSASDGINTSGEPAIWIDLEIANKMDDPDTKIRVKFLPEHTGIKSDMVDGYTSNDYDDLEVPADTTNNVRIIFATGGTKNQHKYNSPDDILNLNGVLSLEILRKGDDGSWTWSGSDTEVVGFSLSDEEEHTADEIRTLLDGTWELGYIGGINMGDYTFNEDGTMYVTDAALIDDWTEGTYEVNTENQSVHVDLDNGGAADFAYYFIDGNFYFFPSY